MIETYQYRIQDKNNSDFNIDCKVEYDTKNSYNTTYYFYDGSTWHKDFIDLEKTSPNNNDLKDDFSNFVTRLHDFMVHGNIWDELRNMKNNDKLVKNSYELVITSKLLNE